MLDLKLTIFKSYSIMAMKGMEEVMTDISAILLFLLMLILSDGLPHNDKNTNTPPTSYPRKPGGKGFYVNENPPTTPRPNPPKGQGRPLTRKPHADVNKYPYKRCEECSWFEEALDAPCDKCNYPYKCQGNT